MKVSKKYKMISLVIVLLLSSTCVYSYPPDNAAVLYYKAALLYSPDDEMKKVIEEFSKESADLSKANINKIREFVNNNRSTIDTVLDASRIKNCDWGLNFSEGLEMKVPLYSMRKMVHLMAADVKILAKDGNFETALSRCISLYKMARHMNDCIFISYLFGVAVNGIANSCLAQIISDMPQDVHRLTWLKNRLVEIDSIPLSVKPALISERDIVLMSMTPEHLPDMARLISIELEEDNSLGEEEKSDKEKVLASVLTFDDSTIERNKKYFENFYAGILDAFDMPYSEGYAVLTELRKKAEKQMSQGNTDATLTVIFRPAVGKMLSIVTRFHTHNNAIRTAIELYIIKTKTGKLPEKLPSDLPGDLFSGKPFDYKKTSNGFILLCRDEEINTGKVHQYEFKLK